MNNWYNKKGFTKSVLDIPVKEEIARDIESLVKEAEANGLSYQRRFISADDIDTLRKGKTEADNLRHTALVTATTNDVDRDSEIVLPAGLDRKYFRKNPVILYGHNSELPPIGYSLWEKMEGNLLKSFIKFADRPTDYPPIEWFPETIFNLVEQKVLRGISIGFLPLDVRPPTEKEILANPSWVSAKRIITKSHLLEISVVPIGCNQNALIEAVTKGLIDAEIVKKYGLEVPQDEIEEMQDWIWETEDIILPAPPVIEQQKKPTREDLIKSLMKKPNKRHK